MALVTGLEGSPGVGSAKTLAGHQSFKVDEEQRLA